jgi:hypothetical protein
MFTIASRQELSGLEAGFVGEHRTLTRLTGRPALVRACRLGGYRITQEAKQEETKRARRRGPVALLVAYFQYGRSAVRGGSTEARGDYGRGRRRVLAAYGKR